MKKTTAIALALLPCTLFAAEEELGWSGTGEFGLVAARGNTETETISLGLKFTNNQEKWRHNIGFAALFASQEGDDTAERFELTGKTDYKINEISYVFGSVRYLDDAFSQFESQATLAGGYGRDLVDTEKHFLNAEAGLGARRSEVRLTGETETEAIFRGVVKYQWTISENAKLTNDLLVEAGSDNTFGQNVTALNTQINDDFGVKIAYEVRHNTDVQSPVNNSDFLTTINLIYNFD